MPFLLLIVGMLSGALVCLLVISTTLAAGSFQITNLQQQNQALSKQQQQLQQQVAQDQAPGVIAQRAEQLGMQPAGQLQFLNVKTGQLSSDAATGAARHPGTRLYPMTVRGGGREPRGGGRDVTWGSRHGAAAPRAGPHRPDARGPAPRGRPA